MKHILISQRVDFLKNYNEFRDSIDIQLNKFVIAAGFLPLPIPNNYYNREKSKLDNRRNFIRLIKNLNIQGIILSGGNDLGYSIDRDLTEYFLINIAKKNFIPL